MWYAECLQKYYNAVDGTFYDVINLEASWRPGIELDNSDSFVKSKSVKLG